MPSWLSRGEGQVVAFPSAIPAIQTNTPTIMPSALAFFDLHMATVAIIYFTGKRPIARIASIHKKAHAASADIRRFDSSSCSSLTPNKNPSEENPFCDACIITLLGIKSNSTAQTIKACKKINVTIHLNTILFLEKYAATKKTKGTP